MHACFPEWKYILLFVNLKSTREINKINKQRIITLIIIIPFLKNSIQDYTQGLILYLQSYDI